ncbi:MAG: hypothetical protein ACT4OX_01220 [Actinomycetota bacterium]
MHVVSIAIATILQACTMHVNRAMQRLIVAYFARDVVDRNRAV